MERLQNFTRIHWRWLIGLALPLLGLLMHLHLMNLPLQGIHAWRQCETASNIVLFAEHDYSIMDPHVYSLEWPDGLKRMEFPIMQWLFGKVVSWVGHETLVMRLLSWLLGLLTMWGFFRLIDVLFQDKWLAVAGAWAWMFSPVIFYYSINPLPDNLSLMMAVWGIAYFLQWHRQRRFAALLLCYACLALSTATKLPFVVTFGVPFGALLGELIRGRGRNILKVIGLSLPGLLLLVPTVAWYLWVIPQWMGNGVVKGILDTTAADIPILIKTLGKNILIILPELLINYGAVLFFAWGIWRIWKDKLFLHRLALPFGLMALGTGAYFIYEINMISSVHDYYLFPFLPGIFILLVIGLRSLSAEVKPWVRTICLIALCILPLTAGLRAYTRWSEKGMPDGLLTNIEALRAATPTTAKIIFANDLSPHISLFHLRHQGWTMDEKEFQPERFNDWLGKGASYFYSNSRRLEMNPVVQPHLGAVVGRWGDIWVWELR